MGWVKQKGEKIKEHVSLVSLLREWLQDGASEQVRLQTSSTYRNYAEKRIIPFFAQYYPDLEAAALTPQIMHEFTDYMANFQHSSKNPLNVLGLALSPPYSLTMRLISSSFVV